jgi:hypothetical protein
VAPGAGCSGAGGDCNSDCDWPRWAPATASSPTSRQAAAIVQDRAQDRQKSFKVDEAPAGVAPPDGLPRAFQKETSKKHTPRN